MKRALHALALLALLALGAAACGTNQMRSNDAVDPNHDNPDKYYEE